MVGYRAGVASRALSGELSRIGFTNARRLVLLVGLVIMVVLGASMFVRSVDRIEAVATLLYFIVFVGLLFYGVVGGVVMAIAATLLYVALRADAIDAVGAGEVAGLIAGRGMAYMLFGVVGGWAAVTLEEAIDRLDRHDAVDDLTGLGNTRSLDAAIDLERARSTRYKSVFSASFAEFPASALTGRTRRRSLRRLGEDLQEAVRTVDHVAHSFDGRIHRVGAVLPETPTAGAEVFQERFVARLREFLVAQGADADVVVGGRICTVPGDEAVLLEQLAPWPRADGEAAPA